MNKTCGNCANYDREIGFAKICTKCIYDQYANDFEREPSEWKPGKHFTNADALRAMSDEELAYELSNRDCPGCPLIDTCTSLTGCRERLLKWLQRPYEGE